MPGEKILTEEGQKAGRLRQAEAYLKAGRCQEAVEIYRELTLAFPGEESLSMALAWAYHDAGRPREALTCFEELFAKELTRGVFTGFAYDELVRFYKTEKQYDRLVDVCSRAVAAQPNDLTLRGELAAAYLKAGRVGASKKMCRQILALEAGAVAVYCLLGEAHLAAKEFHAAEKAFGHAAGIEPAAACSFYGRLAESYHRVGEYQREEKALRRCLQIHPEDPLYHCRRGDCLIGQGRLAEAGAAYEAALALSPQAADVFCYRWGSSLAAINDHQAAIQVFRRVPVEAASYPRIRIRLAESYRALGRHDLAAVTLATDQA